MVSTLRVAVLIDNVARHQGHFAQHGFSALCETDSVRILFDTGATGEVLLRNAAAMGIDLSGVRHIVLSHGHWDHGGGMLEAFDACPEAHAWIPAGALLPRWSRSVGTEARDIALPRTVRTRLVGDRRRWTETTAFQEIAEGAHVTGPVPGARPVWTHKDLLRNPVLGIPDDVPDEQALVFDAPRGLVVVAGCAHYGPDNLLSCIDATFPGRRLLALIGGLHLESIPPADLEHLAARLRQAGVEMVVPCHCSGPAAACRLSALGVPCEQGRVGWTAEF